MGKDIETGVEEEVVVDEGAEVTPEVMTADFATSVAQKAEAVASGDMTIEEFSTEVTTELEAMEAGATPGESDLGGLGVSPGGFTLPEAE